MPFIGFLILAAVAAFQTGPAYASEKLATLKQVKQARQALARYRELSAQINYAYDRAYHGAEAEQVLKNTLGRVVDLENSVRDYIGNNAKGMSPRKAYELYLQQGGAKLVSGSIDDPVTVIEWIRRESYYLGSEFDLHKSDIWPKILADRRDAVTRKLAPQIKERAQQLARLEDLVGSEWFMPDPNFTEDTPLERHLEDIGDMLNRQPGYLEAMQHLAEVNRPPSVARRICKFLASVF